MAALTDKVPRFHKTVCLRTKCEQLEKDPAKQNDCYTTNTKKVPLSLECLLVVKDVIHERK